MHSERFVDASPPTIHATLLDEGQYPCSVRTLYRILTAEDELRERRHVRRHPQYAKPELMATGPNQLWAWDITQLKGPVKWTYFYLYVIIDVFSRYVVDWLVATCESAALAKQIISATCAKQGIRPGQLTLHADRGSSMKSQPVALLLADLGVTKTHSRPYTHQRRQPLQQVPLQDPLIPARLSRTLRRHRGRLRTLPGLLPLVQQRSPPLGDCLHDPGGCPPRPRPGDPRGARPDPRRGLRGEPAALQGHPANPQAAACSGLDQPAGPDSTPPRSPPSNTKFDTPVSHFH